MIRRCGPGRSGTLGNPIAAGCRNTITLRIIIILILGSIANLFLATAAFASGGGGAEGHEGLNWFDFFWRLFNFIVLIGLLYWFLAKKVRSFLSERHDGIQTALAEAVRSLEAAEKKFQEYSEKLDKATGEIDQISEMIKSQGLAEKDRLIEDARRAAAKMRDDAQARMEQEFTKASQQLRVDAVRLSTEMAAELLKRNIKAADHEAMVKDSIEKVVRYH